MARTQLATARLGETGLEISRIGFGAWALGGGGWQFGWGPQDDDESVAAIRRAVELGMTWIDTAPAYGFGRSERVVARALAGLDEPPLVFTKGSLLDDGSGAVVHCLQPDSLRREVEASLERLEVEAIDLYQIHWPVPDEDLEQGWAALAAMKEEGLLRHIGMSNASVEQLHRLQAIAPVETLQPPYSLVDRRAERELLPYAEEHGIGVIVYSPMGSGLLTGAMTRERIEGLAEDDWRRDAPQFREPLLSRNLELVERLAAVGERHGVDPGAVAVAWTLRNPAVDGAIVGFRRPAQVDPLIAAASIELTEADVAEIEG